MLSIEKKKKKEVSNPEILCKDHTVKLLASLDGETDLDLLGSAVTSVLSNNTTQTAMSSPNSNDPFPPLSTCEILTFPEPKTAS